MCDHIAKVEEWGVDTSKPTAPLIAILWGCTLCDEKFFEPPITEERETVYVEHDSFCECFACRVKSIKVAYCGIGGGDATAQKNWDRNLNLYRQARADGIQPTGTSPGKVMAAIKQSEKTGTAFVAG